MVLTLLAFIPQWRERRRRLALIWARPCTGRDWKRQFPESPKEEMRKFLTLLTKAFGFDEGKRLKFNPDDRIMDVYRALYPSGGWPDAMELETFAVNFDKTYNLDTTNVAWSEITLGQLFAMTRILNK